MTATYMITGGSGFLGARVKEYFTTKGYEVAAPTHKELDLLNKDEVTEYIKKVQPKYLIHCAAISDVVTCEKDEKTSYAMNVDTVRNMAEVCGELGTKLIFCSSDQIYFQLEKAEAKENGKPEAIIPHKENEKSVPYNIYGKQKLEAERICMNYCPDAVCLRLAWMYDLKKMNENEHGNFYMTLKENLEKGNTCTFPIHDHRGITYVWSVVKNLEKALELPGGVYNFGSENADNTYDTVRKLFEQKNIAPERLVPNMEAFKDTPRNISMDTEKIKAYGIYFESTLEGLLKEIEL